jgi:hypothetical protein
VREKSEQRTKEKSPMVKGGKSKNLNINRNMNKLNYHSQSDDSEDSHKETS